MLHQYRCSDLQLRSTAYNLSSLTVLISAMKSSVVRSIILGIFLSSSQVLTSFSLHHAVAQPTYPERAASAPLFFCGRDLGTPTTLVRTTAGDRSFIRWTSSHFSSSGWSAERRCQAVSERLQASSTRGNLRFLTTGLLNDQRVICSANSEGGRCLDLIYTLKSGQDPAQALQALVSARQGVGGPVSETTARIYLSIDELLEQSQLSTPHSMRPPSLHESHSVPGIQGLPLPANRFPRPLF